jgi:hypothetical protein
MALDFIEHNAFGVAFEYVTTRSWRRALVSRLLPTTPLPRLPRRWVLRTNPDWARLSR